jgi:hypothetical protein
MGVSIGISRRGHNNIHAIAYSQTQKSQHAGWLSFTTLFTSTKRWQFLVQRMVIREQQQHFHK